MMDTLYNEEIGALVLDVIFFFYTVNLDMHCSARAYFLDIDIDVLDTVNQTTAKSHVSVKREYLK